MFKDKKRRIILSKILRIAILIIGLVIVGFGTGLQHETLLGSSPMTTLSNGIAKQLGIENGQAQIIANIIFIMPGLFFNREKIGIGTILTVFLLGIFCDFFVDLFNLRLLNQLGVQYRTLISLCGTVILSFGLSLYVSMKMGLGGLENLTDLIRKKTGWSWQVCKTGFDSILLITGIVLGGAFGIGTFFSVFLAGVLMQFFFRFTDKIALKINLI